MKEQTPKIYTKGGDKAETSLLSGKRVPKHALRVDTYGSIDELLSQIGLTRFDVDDQETQARLLRVEGELMAVAALVATDDPALYVTLPKVEASAITRLEQEIDQMTDQMPELTSFILPGGVRASASLHVCRSVCRRAERRLSALATTESVAAHLLKYLNRLSDWLFTTSRYVNHLAGVQSPTWP